MRPLVFALVLLTTTWILLFSATVHRTPHGTNQGCFPHDLRDLQERIDVLPWKQLEKEIVSENTRVPTWFSTKYLDLLIPYVEREQLFRSETAEPGPNANLSLLECSSPPEELRGVLTGRQRNPVPNLYDIFTFGYELDVLGIRLHELQGVVDKFGLLESMQTHRGTPKPLFFMRNTHRYLHFLENMIHLVGDHSDFQTKHHQAPGHDWEYEGKARQVLLNKFTKAMSGQIQPYDLILHGDVDEIPDGRLLQYLKYCETTSMPLRFQCPYYYFSFKRTAVGLVHRYPYLFRFDQISGHGTHALRTDSSAAQLLPVGSCVHLTYFGGTAANVFKHLALAEGGSVPRNLAFFKNISAIAAAIAQGTRLCCPGDNYTRPAKYHFIPWVVMANRRQWPAMLPVEDVPIDRPY